jgi:hypothetical protein
MEQQRKMSFMKDISKQNSGIFLMCSSKILPKWIKTLSMFLKDNFFDVVRFVLYVTLADFSCQPS